MSTKNYIQYKPGDRIVLIKYVSGRTPKIGSTGTIVEAYTSALGHRCAYVNWDERYNFASSFGGRCKAEYGGAVLLSEIDFLIEDLGEISAPEQSIDWLFS